MSDEIVRLTPTLLDRYRAMADQGMNFHGMSVMAHADQIGTFAKKLGASSVLDFGCGRGDAYDSPNSINKEWGIDDVTLYDPSFPQHNVLPTGTFDLVVCNDVLEHVPEKDVGAFVAQLFSYAELGVWASVCCRPAKKFFPNSGINLHVTVQRYGWWKRRFEKACKGMPYFLLETE